MSEYKILYGDEEIVYTSETEIKKSKFITYIKKIKDESEACEFIKSIKKKHYDASHNCSAFVVGEKGDIFKSSDDGEPQGTAGRPMLDVLKGSEIVNVVAVVTRYFGGTELGKGGLVKAYSGAVQNALSNLEVAVMISGKRLKITTDYSTVGSVLRKLEVMGVELESSNYTEIIELFILLENDLVEDFINEVIDMSSGKSEVEVIEGLFFPKRI